MYLQANSFKQAGRLSEIRGRLGEPAGREVSVNAFLALIHTEWHCGCCHEVRVSSGRRTIEDWMPCREHALELPAWTLEHCTSEGSPRLTMRR